MSEPPTSPLLVQNLYKHYGRHPVLRGVEFIVSGGEVHGLVGLNGAGKTTTLSAVLGLLPYDQGNIQVLGVSPRSLYRLGGQVAVVFDEPCLPPSLTVGQVLQLAAMTTATTANTGRLAELESLLGIASYHDFKVRELSLGNRRRTAIAQALVGNPALIIMDEPFNGLDAGGVDDVLNLIRELNRDQGITFLLASHQLSYLEQICSHMSFVHQGQIARSDSLENLLSTDRERVRLVTGDEAQARVLLHQLDGVTLVEPENHKLPAKSLRQSAGSIEVELNEMTAAELNRTLVNEGVEVYELIAQRHTIDDKFREITATVEVTAEEGEKRSA